MKENYDIIVIGAGAGGMNAAYKAVEMNKSVLLIEKFKPGGDCTWTGCIPSKALIQLAEDFHTAKKFGLQNIDSKKVMNQVRELILTAHQAETVEVLEEAGINFLQGSAKFINPYTVEVNGLNFSAKHFIISTGSSPYVPNLKGLNNIEFLTNETIFQLTELPKDLIILGAGAIGVELSQALNRLGVEVKLIEMADSILYREDKEVTSLMDGTLRKEGVKIYLGAKATEVVQDGANVKLTFETNGGNQTLVAEKILIALGRTANVQELNLEKAGVDYTEKQVPVNSYMQTSTRHIYAVGDIAGPYYFSHMASIQGRLAVEHLCGQTQKGMTEDYAWCTFTHPELARTGLTEEEARSQYGNGIKVYKKGYDEVDRAVIDQKTVGMAKIICDHKGKILGASILGERACEMLCELQVLKLQDLPFSKLQNAIHPYPSYSELLLNMSREAATDK